MWGSRSSQNILLESDCACHQSCDHPHTHHLKPQCTDRYFSEGHGSREARDNASPRDTRRPCSTMSGSSGRKISFQADQYHPQDNLQKEYNERFTKEAPSDGHIGTSSQEDYQQQFRQGIADNVQPKIGRVGVDDCSWNDVTNVKCRNNESRCARDKPEGTSFSCNDCMEPQCLYCWRKFQEAKQDFMFLDGFETKEQKWKPGKRNVDQFNNFSMVHNQHNPRSSNSLEDRFLPETHQHMYKENPCQPSCPPKEPKWKSANNMVHDNQEGHEPDEHHNARCDPPSRENQGSGSSGKGRGMGPVPGEWVPPFRRFSSQYPPETFHRSKGPGAIPNLDDWVPPFRGEEQPYSWHRCKGSGGCPPRDQWHAPWSDSIRNKSVGQVHGA